MKYTVEVIINKPLEFVSNTLRSREAALVWMEGLQKFELIEGEFEAVGSKYMMEFKQGKKISIMTETIKEFNPPYSYDMLYEMGGVWNLTINRFIDLGNETTKYIMENEFRFKFPLNLILPLLPKMFQKETLKGMNSFKDYVESL